MSFLGIPHPLGAAPARCIWLTGLPAAGKTTLASALEQRLRELGRMTCVLDGDSLRKGLCRDLGFSQADRVENIRRGAAVAGWVFVAGIVEPPLEKCVRRDPKGMYARAGKGELKDFTGIGSRYERPENPDVRIDTRAMSVEESVERGLRLLASSM